jgi:hypothetical protein
MGLLTFAMRDDSNAEKFETFSVDKPTYQKEP